MLFVVVVTFRTHATIGPWKHKNEVMKKLAWISICWMFASAVFAQPLKTDWAVKIGGDDFVLINAVALQPSGHVLLAGQFTGTIDANPGEGIQWLNSAGNYDAYLIQLDAAGDFVWAKRIGGAGYDDVSDMITDPAGNIYLTGVFGGIVDFNPGSGVANMTSEGGSDIYVLKLDPEGGFVWARHFGGPNSDGPESISIDASGQLHVTGYFSNTADFDPGPGFFPLTSVSGADVFVLKLSAAGNPVWVKPMGGAGNNFGYNVLTDAAGNVYTYGLFQDQIDFDPGTTDQIRTSRGGYDIFICKFNAIGNYVWVRHIGGEGDELPQDMCMDKAGNLIVTGFFDTELDVDPTDNELIFSPLGEADAFVVKVTQQGQMLWARQIAGTEQSIVERCAILPDNGVVVTGRFSGELHLMDADPQAFPPIASAGGQDIYWVKYDADGLPQWAATIGGPFNDGGGTYFALTTDDEGHIFTGGWVRYAIDFDPGPGELILPQSDAFQVFVSRMREVSTGLDPVAMPIPVQVWPNPGNGPVFVTCRQGDRPVHFRVLDGAGRVAREGYLQPGAVQALELPDADGTWFLHLRDDQGRQQVQRIVRLAR